MRISNLSKVLFGVFTLLASSSVFAHVKWFSPYDTQQTPQSIERLLSAPGFLIAVTLSIILVFSAIYVDASVKKINTGFKQWKDHRLKLNWQADWLYRTFQISVLIFFTSLWSMGGVILTPELTHDSYFVGFVQLIIIATTIKARTAWVAGIGIFVLWFYAMLQYGLFHLSDYMFFLGVAYLLFKGSAKNSANTVSLAVAFLYLEVTCALMWGSVEKWSFPDWFYPILDERPYLLMGFDKDLFVYIAGLVEFSLAFLLLSLSGAAVLTMVGLGFSVIFLVAIIDFGKIDAIGHLLIVVSLIVIALNGPSRINQWFNQLDERPAVRALKISGIYICSLIFFVFFYQFFQWSYNSYLNFH